MIPIVGLWPIAAMMLVAADGIPRFDVQAHCRRVAGIIAAAADAAQQVDSCIRDENAARDQLTKEWPQFTADQKSSCVQLATTEGAAPTFIS